MRSVTAPNSLGASLLVLTGDDEYVRSLQNIAKSKLATLDAFGIWRGTDSTEALIASAPTTGPIIKSRNPQRLGPTQTEEMVYEFLGVEPREPEERTYAESGSDMEDKDVDSEL